MLGIGLGILGFAVLTAVIWWLLGPVESEDPAVDAPSCNSSISGDGSDNDKCCRTKQKSYKLDQSTSCCRSTPVNTFEDVDVITPIIVSNMMSQSSYPNRDVDIASVASTYSPPPVAEVTKDTDFSSMNTAPTYEAPSTPSYDSSPSYSSSDSSYSSSDSGGSCDSGGCGCGGD